MNKLHCDFCGKRPSYIVTDPYRQGWCVCKQCVKVAKEECIATPEVMKIPKEELKMYD